MLPYFLSFLSGYLVGSFPTGYLLVKRKSNLDITVSGSGNAGAFNASVVTGSKVLGIAVGLIDGLKGAAAVLIGELLLPGFWGSAVGVLGAVIGHNYPVWLRFKGGRGLATACGGLLLLGPSYVIVWCTNSVQAWRQTEKAAWLEIPEAIRKRSLLVLSHADRLQDDVARDKVLRRVVREASEYFAAIRMASFIKADDVKTVVDDLVTMAGKVHAEANGTVLADEELLQVSDEGLGEQVESLGDDSGWIMPSL